MKTLSRLKAGEQIDVLASDENFCMDVTTLVRAKKCIIVFQEEKDDYNYFILEKI